MRFSAAVKNLRGQADPPPQAAPEPSGAEISPEEPVSSESPAPKSSGPVTSAWQSSSGQMQAPHSDRCPRSRKALHTDSRLPLRRLFFRRRHAAPRRHNQPLPLKKRRSDEK